MQKLSRLSLYNLKDQLVTDQLTGTLEQQLHHSTFESYLKLDGEHPNHFKVGENYYAVGVTENGMPLRSETVQCKVAGPHPVFEGKLQLPPLPDSKTPSAASSKGYMSIEYTNYSGTSFDLSTNGSHFEKGLGGLITAPGPVLQANSGQESMSGDQILSGLEHGDSNIYLCWGQNNYYYFGVWINFPIQVLRIGKRPYWYVTTNGGAWTLSGSDPAYPYTWNTAEIPYNIVATPASEHTSLSIQVVITDLNN